MDPSKISENKPANYAPRQNIKPANYGPQQNIRKQAGWTPRKQALWTPAKYQKTSRITMDPSKISENKPANYAPRQNIRKQAG